VGPDGHIVEREELDAQTDADATIAARAIYGAHKEYGGFQIWQNGNCIHNEGTARATNRPDESDATFRKLVEGIADYAIYTLNLNGVVMTWNAGAERIKGYTAGEIIGQNFARFYTEEDQETELPKRALATAARIGKFEAEGWRVRKDGSRFWASAIIDAIHDGSGAVVQFAKITCDLTERRLAEERMRQSQKMDAVGQLTGGVAHDFNNLLTIIGGNIQTAQRQFGGTSAQLDELLSRALRGTERATTLVHRLLAFSRQQPLDPRPVDVNKLVINMSDLLVRTIGESIKIETVLSAGLWPIAADTNQLENALLNLAVNARDAMPAGGKLTIETANALLDEAYAASNQEVAPGQYIMLAVTDSGYGMTPDVIAKAFDPFFTTKKTGEGTGLGLSQVYGFVKQSRGHIKLYSEPGQGTTVKLYFPRAGAAEAPVLGDERLSIAPLATDKETILVVEDEPDVRQYSVEILRELGYVVLEAADGDAALSQLMTEPRIKLLFTDIGLPGAFNGRQLADEARRRRPDIRVLFTTGYARNAIIHNRKLDRGVELIVKPFTYDALAAKIRLVLDED
jgi:PAS domain S-box-containing protein